MALTATQAVDARQRIVTAVFGNQVVTVTKPQIDAVAASATSWLETNGASFVTALNGTVAQGQSAAVMSSILAAVATARYGGGA